MGSAISTVSTTTSGSGTGLTVRLNVSWDYYYNWDASWSIVDKGNGYKVGDTITIARPSGLPSIANTNGSLKVFPNGAPNISVTGIKESTSVAPEGNLNQLDAIADYVQIPGMEQKSHQDGPEHEIAYVNELMNPGSGKASYMDLAIGGVRINSAKEWTNFTQLSAYFKKGIKVPDLLADLWNSTNTYTTGDIVFYKGKSYKARPDSNGNSQSFTNKIPDNEPFYWEIYTTASNNFVEIAYALLTDPYLGAGDLVGVNAVGDMTEAAKFVRANGFTWDGVISNKINLRDFLHTHGTYNLLDFTVIGGKFSLLPAVPYDGEYKIQHNKKIEVSGLFTDGNIKDLKVSFLSPEERQLFKANVLYRKEKVNGFAETKSVMFRLGDTYGGKNTDPIETYDLSGFATTREQAVKYAKYILKIRKEVDHGLSFKTAPQYCVNLAPGSYIRLVSEATHVERYSNGVITDSGEVVSKDDITGVKDIYYWKPGTTVEKVKEANNVNFTTKEGLPLGVLFTIKDSVTTNRVYKVETISYAEDGLVEISGSHAPLTDSGSLAILDGWSGVLNHFMELT